MKKSELQIVESPQLLEVVKSSKIELSKAQSYAYGYAPFMDKVNELSLALSDLDKSSPSQEHAKIARAKRLELVKVRKAAELKKTEDKELILIEGRLIDGLFKVVENTAKLTENDYLEIEKHQERIEADKKAKLKIERIEKLEQFDIDLTFIAIEDMSVEQFDIFFDSQKTAFEAKKETEKLAEIARIEAEKKAEADRIAKEKSEKEERLRIEAENAKLKADQERIEKEREVERKKMAEIQAKKDAEARREMDRLAAIAKAEKEASDKAAIAAKAKADKDAAEIARVKAELKSKEEAASLAHEQEKQRIADEEADKIAKLKAAALAPDKEKINAMYVEIKNFKFPELSDPDAIKLVEEVKQGFSIILEAIKTGAKKLQ